MEEVEEKTKEEVMAEGRMAIARRVEYWGGGLRR